MEGDGVAFFGSAVSTDKCFDGHQIGKNFHTTEIYVRRIVINVVQIAACVTDDAIGVSVAARCDAIVDAIAVIISTAERQPAFGRVADSVIVAVGV